MNYSNTISGSGSLVNNGSGTIYLLNANTFTGGITNNSGNLVLSNNAAAGSGAVVLLRRLGHRRGRDRHHE